MTMTTCNTCTRPIAKTHPSALRLVSNAIAVYRQRRALGKLDAAALTDIGISPREAATEARRPFWDVPATWRR